jgi:hypothetical protein
MLLDKDLVDLGFKIVRPTSYTTDTDIFQKAYVVSTDEFERKKIILMSENNFSDPTFCYFFTIIPRGGYDFKHGLEIHKSSVPYVWGESVFKGKVENKEDLNKLLDQLND